MGAHERMLEWWGQGQRVELSLEGQPRGIFVLDTGDGPPMTLLHGFPSSSHDWAKVTPTLARVYSLLLLDFLGYGASDKPRHHVYSLHEQADLVEALWAAQRVTATALVAHDYGVSVAQELLARRAEGRLGAELRSLHLLNGGVYPDLHRPQPTQLALLDPQQGPALSELITEQLFAQVLRPTFAERFDPADDSADIWQATAHEGGERIAHLLIGYIRDREQHAERWVGALEHTDVPVAFVWGMLDPVSGAHMAGRIRERMPYAPFWELSDVSHWPQLEAHERVAEALLAARQDD
jgi:pimeloyl-ACP methyl ester carboxylesterase